MDFCAKGFWMLLPYDDMRDLPGLRLSPIGVVPQRDWRPRVIVDYTFFGLNDETLKLSDPRSMQFHKAQECMLQACMHDHRPPQVWNGVSLQSRH
jgi:hypothetical protein